MEFEILSRLDCAKAWTEGFVFDPDAFLRDLDPRRFAWQELRGLVGRGQAVEQAAACRTIQERYRPLRDLSELGWIKGRLPVTSTSRALRSSSITANSITRAGVW